jgi:O-antigen/teichoic acid export membrane protein
VAASMITFISGLLSAIINVIMPYAARLHAREQAEDMGRLVVSSTRFSALLLILTGIPMFLYAGPIIRVWIGQRYMASGAPLLEILIVANIIRLVGMPYAVIMVAAGQQNYIKVSPLSEGISNFGASIALALLFGGIGVALGTLVGSTVGIVSHLWYSMPRTKPVINFSRRDFLISGVLSPLLWTSPLLATAAASWRGTEIRPLVFALATTLSLMGAAWLIFRRPRIPQG